MNLELKNVKHSEFASQETACFQASVYVNGSRAFSVSNDGQGGCNSYHPFDNNGKALLKEAEAYVKTLPKKKYEDFGGFEISVDLDTLINELFYQWQEKRTLKKWCKKETVLRMPKDSGGEYMIIKHPYGEAMKKYVAEKYPMASIINEEFLTD